jgi:hypothetical protein
MVESECTITGFEISSVRKASQLMSAASLIIAVALISPGSDSLSSASGIAASLALPPRLDGWSGASAKLRHARQYWVSPKGVDSAERDGSNDSPWRTIAYADSRLNLGEDGAVIHVSGQQTYSSLATSKSGRPSARIYFQGEDGAGITFSDSSGWIVRGDYVTVEGFEITGPYLATAIDLWGDGDNAIGNYIHDLTGTGSFRPNCPPAGAIMQNPALGRDQVRDVSYLGGEISANRINNVGARDSSCPEWHGIYAKFPHTFIRNNIISNVGKGWGIQLYGYSCYDSIVNNTIFGNMQGALILSHGTWQNDGAAAAQCDINKPQDYLTVTNNSLLDTTNPSGPQNERGHGLTLYSGACQQGYVPFGKHILISNNLMYGNANGDFYDSCHTGYNPQNNYADASGTATFVYYRLDGKGDYHLRAGSRAVANGTVSCATGQTLCAPQTDFEGARRSQSGSYDIGAYIYSNAPAKRLARH